eukprot:14149447-Alexandrium_andersonii.AAC.1
MARGYLRPRLQRATEDGHRYHTLVALALVLAQGLRRPTNEEEGWTKNVTEDGDVEDNPGTQSDDGGDRHRAEHG